ncbi:MAG: hypothetical protein OXN95_09730 [bacterium]|nr:hypothetical protein [bacterium]
MSADTAQVRAAVESIRSQAQGQANEKLAELVLCSVELAMDSVDGGGKMNAALLSQLRQCAGELGKLIDLVSADDPLAKLRAI